MNGVKLEKPPKLTAEQAYAVERAKAEGRRRARAIAGVSDRQATKIEKKLKGIAGV